MSHIDLGPLAAYNSLTDSHLTGYFCNPRKRRHLVRAGLITKNGRIVSETTYRLSMAKKEHKKYVKDLLAHTIVHKTLDLERQRQSDIQKKIEEIAKIELVRRVKMGSQVHEYYGSVPWIHKVKDKEDDEFIPVFRTSFSATPDIYCHSDNEDCRISHRKDDRASHSRRGDEDLLPFLSPRGTRTPALSSSHTSLSSSVDQSSRKTSSSVSTEHQRDIERARPESHKFQSGDSRFNIGYMQGTQSREHKEYMELDSRYLQNLDSVAMQKYGNVVTQHERGFRAVSPYLMPQISALLPSPPKTPRSYPNSARSNRSRSLFIDKKTDADANAIKGSLMIHRPEPALMNQELVQSMVSVTMKYLGKNLVLPRDQVDPYDEVCIDQQHCGGNTLPVFKELLLPGSTFKFISRRHRGYPFSLSLYVDHVLDCRVSACCEYKHTAGTKLGGKAGHFTLLTVKGSEPCFRCHVEKEMRDKKRKKKKRELEAEKKREALLNDAVVTAIEDVHPEKTTVTGDTRDIDEEERIIVPVEQSDAEDMTGESTLVDVTAEADKYEDEDFEDNANETSTSNEDSETDSERNSDADDYSDEEAGKGDKSSSDSEANKDNFDSETEEAVLNKSCHTQKDDSDSIRNSMSSDTGATSETLTVDHDKGTQLVLKQESRESSSTAVIWEEGKTSDGFSAKKEAEDTTKKKENHVTVESDNDEEHHETLDTRDINKEDVNRRSSIGGLNEFENVTDDQVTSYSSDESSVHQLTSQLAVVQVHHGSDENLISKDETVTSNINLLSEENGQGDDIRIGETDADKSVKSDSDKVQAEYLSSKGEDNPRSEDISNEGQQHMVYAKKRAYWKSAGEQNESEALPEADLKTEVIGASVSQEKDGTSDEHDSDTDSSGQSSSENEDKIPNSDVDMTHKTNDLIEESDFIEGANTMEVDEKKEDVELANKEDALNTSTTDRSEDLGTITEEYSTVHRTDTSMDTGDTYSVEDIESSNGDEDDVDAVLKHQQCLSMCDDVPGELYNGSIRPLISDSDILAIHNISLNKQQLAEVDKYIEESCVLSEVTLVNGQLDTGDVENMCQSITASSATPKILNLSVNNLSVSAVSPIVETVLNKPTIKYLILHGNPIGDSGVKALMQGLFAKSHSSGERFNLFRGVDTSRNFDSPVSSDIIDAIASDRKLSDEFHPPMKAMPVQPVSRKVVYGQEALTEHDGKSKSSLVRHVELISQELREVIEQHPPDSRASRGCVLEELDVGLCAISDVGAQDIGSMLGSNAALLSLNLRGNTAVTADGWRAIGAGLRQNKSLVRLTLQGCQIRDAGLVCLAKEIRYNLSLRKLDLSNCGLSDVGGKAIIELLKMNTSLIDICLMPGNDISEDILNEIMNYLSLNQNFHRPYNLL